MADKTIGQLDEIVTAAPTDMLEIEQISSGLSKRITKANLVGGNITGGGTVATGGNNLTVSGPSTINGSLLGNMSGGGLVATGGFTLTVSAASTISGSHVGTVNGNISGGGTIATGGFTLTVGGTSTINGNISGGGTLALGGFTLTVPATGTASLLALAQTYSALKTFSAGINLGQASNLSVYEEGTWTLVITGSVSNPTITYTAQNGKYTRIGNILFYTGFLTINTISGGSGDVRVSLPVTVAGPAYGICLTSGVDLAATPSSLIFVANLGTQIGNVLTVHDNAGLAVVNISGLAAGDRLDITGFYFV